MSQPDQNPTPQVPTGPRTGPQEEGGKRTHISTAAVAEPAGGKGPHIIVTVQALQPTGSIVSPGLQTATAPSSQEPDVDDPSLDGGKGPH